MIGYHLERGLIVELNLFELNPSKDCFLRNGGWAVREVLECVGKKAMSGRFLYFLGTGCV